MMPRGKLHPIMQRFQLRVIPRTSRKEIKQNIRVARSPTAHFAEAASDAII